MTNTTYDYVTKPLYATVGAGDALYTVVADALSQVRGRAGTASTDVSGSVEKLREQFAKLPADVQSQIAELRERFALTETPKDLAELRALLTREDLRKTADSYLKSALEYYGELATRGEETVVRLRADERVAQAEDLATDALHRVEEAVAKITEVVAGKTEAPAEKPAEGEE